jgi:AcrR family transcriptional regulator
MAAPRRMGTENSKTRFLLLDVTERLMVEKGYAEVGVRRVAREAGVAPALVLYYFRTLDDLFLAVLKRRAEQEYERQVQALRDMHPVRAVWEFNSRPVERQLLMEFIALGNHRKAVGKEMAGYAERIRRLQVQALAAALPDTGDEPGALTPLALTVLITSISQGFATERAMGITAGHAEARAVVEHYLRRLEGDAASA